MSQSPTPAPAEDRIPLRRALVSVYDKTGLAELVTALHDAGVQIVSTGSTAARVAEAGVPVTPVEEVTGFPECLDGRVKTLHPAVHAGILADRRKPAHRAELAELGVVPFDLVVVNLYPFTQTVASGADAEECVEQIDIGGPTMVRAAAKNHPSVAVVVDPARYTDVARAAAGGGFTLAERRALAAQAFRHTASYDVAVASWMGNVLAPDDEVAGGATGFPGWAGATWERQAVLRYGENPHQRAALYTAGHGEPGLAQAEQLHGKAMSYNNYVDADAAWRAAHDHQGPAVAVVKHNNPCGIATGADVAEAHRKAHACDPVSAYGGVVAANRPVTAAMAEQLAPVFTEVVLAPDFEPAAVEILARKKNVRLLRVAGAARGAVETRPIAGGLLMQATDRIDAPGDDPAGWTLAAGPAADEATLADLAFAWRAVRAVKSNAILLARDGASVGVGMGQVNRVDSCRLAVERANTLGAPAGDDGAGGAGAGGAGDGDGADAQDGDGGTAVPERARGAVAASDAFFPFADGLQVLIDAGVRAVVQPGGSVRDAEVVAAAEAAGITMYFTGTRHFAH
ncbi:bifunctional phosphoribosylaminoimidazolecarboxamide formyltransferase/IMP cyclohydrolase [Georgenia sp. TF02-10]|uniref:bifunctional phosphoribosylaminoimidazolecarboxamide formyltransferase/IMP cyclohydrolase n=1 Tax=Georgenia sp. TF02-10 TaxID=2917725 RepID=UPI001FA7FA94|nr:bifunctional phosphoribosylaminoimidazolecarboxamide formyltransferase/IMP cyclohydrolase [Georgenia sp. TF02-10]UNX54265.1 bifunctional phosphoribosylaminoimidazolecarboxamide formyltransferase/IMP cyclohydrolase [Georgenia sp. TF02-10]